jgi:hypothetical protein
MNLSGNAVECRINNRDVITCAVSDVNMGRGQRKCPQPRQRFQAVPTYTVCGGKLNASVALCPQ